MRRHPAEQRPRPAGRRWKRLAAVAAGRRPERRENPGGNHAGCRRRLRRAEDDLRHPAPVAGERPDQRAVRPRVDHRGPSAVSSSDRRSTAALPSSSGCAGWIELRELEQLQPELLERERAAGTASRRRERVDRRADVVAVAGQRQLGGASPASDLAGPLDARAPSGRREPTRSLPRGRSGLRRRRPRRPPISPPRRKALGGVGGSARWSCAGRSVYPRCARCCPPATTAAGGRRRPSRIVTSASAPRYMRRARAACASSARLPSCARRASSRSRRAGRSRASAPAPGHRSRRPRCTR